MSFQLVSGALVSRGRGRSRGAIGWNTGGVHVCETCGKSFSSLGNMRKHALIHTGLKPYQCPQCGRRFLLKHHLQKHLGTVHARVA